MTTAGTPSPGAALVLLAGGSGQRSGHATNKVLLPLAGRRVLTWSLDCTAALAEITRTVVVARAADRAEVDAVLAQESPGRAVTVVAGGATRHASEWAALTALAAEIRAGLIDVVVVHDAARPLARSELFQRVINAARTYGGALPGLPMAGLVRRDGAARADETADAQQWVSVQTPQAFRAGPLLDAYEAAEEVGFVGSDTAACVERFGRLDVAYLRGERYNIKLTFAEDLAAAERLVALPDRP